MTQWGSDPNAESGDEHKQSTPTGEPNEPGTQQPSGAEPWGQSPPPVQPPAGGDPWGPPSASQPSQPSQPGQPGQPPYGAPPSGQPPYGQPEYGQPPYGQPGQPPYGAPPPGQPPYGQPQYGQPEYGQPQYGQPPYGQPEYGQYGQYQGQYGQGYPAAPGYNPYADASAAQNGWISVPGLGTVQVASVGRRFLARFIDGLILLVIWVVLLGFGLKGVSTTTHTVCDANNICVNQTSTSGLGGFFATALLISALYFLYEWLMIAFRGQTLGKMAMGVKVVRAEDGQIPGIGRAFVRQIILAVSNAVCFLIVLLMYISVFFDGTGRRQTWYDKAARDFVIQTRP